MKRIKWCPNILIIIIKYHHKLASLMKLLQRFSSPGEYTGYKHRESGPVATRIAHVLWLISRLEHLWPSTQHLSWWHNPFRKTNSIDCMYRLQFFSSPGLLSLENNSIRYFFFSLTPSWAFVCPFLTFYTLTLSWPNVLLRAWCRRENHIMFSSAASVKFFCTYVENRKYMSYVKRIIKPFWFFGSQDEAFGIIYEGKCVNHINRNM